MTAVALRFHNPMAHFVIGAALHRLNVVARSIEALELAVAQNPNFPEAYVRLAYIYGKRLGDGEEAGKYRNLARAARKRIRELKTRDPARTVEKADFALTAKTSDQIAPPENVGPPATPDELSDTVLVVTGLPRSGTSMMMQMLLAGGMAVLTDEVRGADESNPKGYFEHEKVRALRKDNTWIPEAKGRAVKIVTQLLAALPPPGDFRYRVIFMDRDLGEVVRSQTVMLERLGKGSVAGRENRIAVAFANSLTMVRRWLASRKVPVLTVAHAEAVSNPAVVAGEVSRFLGGGLDEGAMAAVVDPALYRVKAGSETEE